MRGNRPFRYAVMVVGLAAGTVSLWNSWRRMLGIGVVSMLLGGAGATVYHLMAGIAALLMLGFLSVAVFPKLRRRTVAAVVSAFSRRGAQVLVSLVFLVGILAGLANAAGASDIYLRVTGAVAVLGLLAGWFTALRHVG